MRNILIGDSRSKRTTFFLKAAKVQGISVETLEWDLVGEFDWERFEGAAVKIDPPLYTIVSLKEMREELFRYREFLERLGRCHCHFLNTPQALWQTLDKAAAKRRLLEAGVGVTQLLSAQISTADELEEWMRSRRAVSVFVKPSLFSGAAGVVALRRHPATGKMTGYTSCRMEKGTLINTKKLFCLSDRREIMALLDAVLALGAVVERWHPKDSFRGKSYDLRIVYQFGGIACAVVRQSSGPITNLHLNNQALDPGELAFPKEKVQEIEELCRRAMAAFPGLSSAGLDVMLERGSLRPLVIEVNGQGDLLYRDIYRENGIYGQQVREMEALWKKSI